MNKDYKAKLYGTLAVIFFVCLPVIISVIIMLCNFIGEKFEHPKKNIFIYWSNSLYEYVDWIPPESNKTIHIIPPQEVWNKYGYNIARQGLYQFQFNIGNRPVICRNDGIYVINQDNGVMYIDGYGNSLTYQLNPLTGLRVR